MGIAILIIAILIVAAAAGFAAVKARRTRELRASFGPEYDRMVAEHGSASAADAEARRRQRAHSDLELQELSEDDKTYYAESWSHVRADFVDHPAAALAGGDRLLRALLQDLGYRGEPDEQMALLSVPHGPAVAGYRDAREVVREVSQDPDKVPTERIRVALAAYGRLAEELVGSQPVRGQAVPEARAA
jgi:hypothetical protein